MSRTDTDKTDVAIIGAGVSGIALAVRLKRAGFNDFTIYERDNGVGGTWLTNAYPGCRCDVPAHWYSLSTHLNRTWSQSHPPQDEILAYWQRVAVDEGILAHCRFGVNFEAGVWDSAASRWTMTLRGGSWVDSESGEAHRGADKEVFKASARVLVSGIGGFSKPIIPPIQGLPAGTGLRSRPASKAEKDKDPNGFAGTVVHSARYPRKGLDVAGKRVLVVGNGCSGSQIIPAISKDKSVTVYAAARSAQWYMPHKLEGYSSPRLTAYRWLWPLAVLHRFFLWLTLDIVWFALPIKSGAWMRDPIQKQMEEYMKKTAPPEVLDTLLPKFPWGGKRFIRDTGYLRSLHQENVTPIITGIRELKQNSFVTKEGKEYPIDVVILATGFDVMSAQLNLTGRTGEKLQEHVKVKQASDIYHGMTSPGFPNLYLMLGPNTAPSHASVIFPIEVQADYIKQVVIEMRNKQMKALEVKEQAAREYDNWISPRLSSTVWTTAAGFYHANNDKNARITTNWPGMVFLYWLQNARPRWNDYIGAEKAGGARNAFAHWASSAGRVIKFAVTGW